MLVLSRAQASTRLQIHGIRWDICFHFRKLKSVIGQLK